MMQPGRKYSAGDAYRYGFNGQEKSNEISNDENNYTAEFWQYDARLGRRWNVDPVVKANRSPYETFSGNPVIMIDPKGDDDTWSIDLKTGKIKLVTSTETGQNIYIIMGDKPVLLSEIKINWKDKKFTQGIADIVANYAAKAEISFNQNCEYEDGVFSGGVGIAADHGDGSKAFYDPKDQGLYVSVNNGYIDKDMANYANLKNTFVHENKHKTDPKSKTYKYSNHLEVYIYQIQDKTFKETSEDWKMGIISNAFNYLLNTLRETEYSSTGEEYEDLKKRLDEAVSKAGFKVEGVTRNNQLSIRITNTSTGKEEFYEYKKYKNPH